MIVIAIDWSGAGDKASPTGLAEVDASTGEVLRLESGWSRGALADYAIEASRRNPELVVGLDFAFSLPRWFAHERGIPDGAALWDLVASEGERWLSDCSPPFWGRPGKKRPDLEEHFRRTDADVPSIGGIRPKSFKSAEQGPSEPGRFAECQFSNAFAMRDSASGRSTRLECRWSWRFTRDRAHDARTGEG